MRLRSATAGWPRRQRNDCCWFQAPGWRKPTDRYLNLRKPGLDSTSVAERSDPLHTATRNILGDTAKEFQGQNRTGRLAVVKALGAVKPQGFVRAPSRRLA